MSLFAASLLPGVVLIGAGAPLLSGHEGYARAVRAFPRAVSVGYAVFGIAAAWFLLNISRLSDADFGEYRVILFIGFAAVALLAYKCVPDFLGVRGASALVLLAATPFLDAAYMKYDQPLRLFMVSFVYVAIALAIWIGAQPWRLRDFFNWLFAKPVRSRGLGAAMVVYGCVLCVAAFGLK